MKTEIKPLRCKRCKKNTLTEISSPMQQINPFSYRSFSGVMCTSCNWSQKEYVFKDVVEEGKD
jgi:hypothetical protein